MIKDIDLIQKLENISINFPNRLLKLEGYLLRENSKELLEIIIFKGFSSSTTHQIEIDQEKKVINFDLYFINFKMFKAPLKKRSEEIIREGKDSNFFLDERNWK